MAARGARTAGRKAGDRWGDGLRYDGRYEPFDRRFWRRGCVATHGARGDGSLRRSLTVSQRDRSPFFIFALKRFVQNLVDFRVGGISRVAVIAGSNRDRNAAMNITFVAPLPKSDLFLAFDDVTFPTN